MCYTFYHAYIDLQSCICIAPTVLYSLILVHLSLCVGISDKFKIATITIYAAMI